jgi:DNA helicase IV
MRASKTEDKAALEQQYNIQGRVLDQIRRGKPEAHVDPENPYFAHLKVRAEGRTTEVFLGRNTRVGDGVRIVDWRHAPVSAATTSTVQSENKSFKIFKISFDTTSPLIKEGGTPGPGTVS